MSNRCNDLGTPDRATPDDHTDDLTEGERVLLAHLAALVAGEHELPRHVEAAAKALHDWARVDDCLAEIAAPAMLTRADDHAFDIDLQQVRLHVDVEPAGYRRRRLGITVSHAVRPAGGATPESISALRVQFPDGRVEELHADPLGSMSSTSPMARCACLPPWCRCPTPVAAPRQWPSVRWLRPGSPPDGPQRTASLALVCSYSFQAQFRGVPSMD